MHDPMCEQLHHLDELKYGFTLYKNEYYWTKITEIKQCCPIKVKLIDYTSTNVYVEYNGKQYIKPRKEFMENSWRVIDAY